MVLQSVKVQIASPIELKTIFELLNLEQVYRLFHLQKFGMLHTL